MKLHWIINENMITVFFIYKIKSDLHKDHVNYNAKLFPKRQYTNTLITVDKKVDFPDKFLLEQKFLF